MKTRKIKHGSQGKKNKSNGFDKIAHDACIVEEKKLLSRWNIESDVRVETLTHEQILAMTAGGVDIPSVKLVLLTDFCGDVVLKNGKKAYYRFRFASFDHSRVKNLKRIGSLFSGKFEPVAEFMVQYEDARLGAVICHLKDKPAGACTRVVPITFVDFADEMNEAWTLSYSAMLLTQDAMLHRSRTVKRAPGDSLQYVGTGKVKQSKSGTTIKLGKTVKIHTTTEKRFCWTEFWIVGGHLRRIQTKNSQGETVYTTTRVKPHLKGPKRDSDEAKAFLKKYLESDTRTTTIVL